MEDAVTILSLMGGLAMLLFTFYKLGMKPQFSSIKEEVGGVREIIRSVKKSVEKNTQTLQEHGNRLTRVEAKIEFINCEEEED